MHPRITELLDFVDRERQGLRQAVDSVPSERRDVSPGPDRWSVAGVLEHLAILEVRVAALLRSRVAEARAAGVGQETDASPILATMNLGGFGDRRTRLQAGDVMRPTGMDANTAWDALEAARRDFRNAVIEADGVALADVMHPHRVFGPINLYQWIGFTGAHEARHADQIREIGEQLATAQAS
ncbi:MAG: DinB family protein [bacterium]